MRPRRSANTSRETCGGTMERWRKGDMKARIDATHVISLLAVSICRACRHECQQGESESYPFKAFTQASSDRHGAV
eukprot:scaffold27979_cov28-Tisochrysis_lutea.AAC.3